MNGLPSYLQEAFNSSADTKTRMDSMRQAILDHPEDELLLTQQLAIYSSVDDNYDETQVLCERLLALDTEKQYTADAFHILARTWLNKKDKEKAIDYYRRAMEIDPGCEDSIIELAEIYFKDCNYDEAIQVYALLDRTDIIDGKENMLRCQASCYYNQQEFAKALDLYQQAYQMYPEDEDGWLSDSIGETYWQMKNYEEAMMWFRRELEKNPASARAHYGIGHCYQDMGDHYRALHHYFEAIKIKPDFPEAYNNIAFIEVNFEGEHKKGLEFLEKALQADPDDKFKPLLYQNLTRLYKSMGEYELSDHYKIEYIRSMGFDAYYEEDDDDGDDGDILK